MNLCTFGIHDYETINESQILLKALQNYLLNKGFVMEVEEYGNVWRNGTITLRDWGFIHDHDTIEDCYNKYEIYSKVCVICGKVKLGYSIEKSIYHLQNLIDRKTDEHNRRKKAKEFRLKGAENGMV